VGPRLTPPDVRYQRSFLAALAEYQAEGAHTELPLEALADPAEFARYVTALRADVERPGEPDRYVTALTGTPSPDGAGYERVPQTILWWVDGDEYLGRLSIRHRLTPALLHEGGSLGYEVRPGARRRGHATAMLAAALPIVAGLGVDDALLDCDVGNVASRRVIETNGGRLDRREGDTLFFLVPTGGA
jgi:RimJ/RimL family protein N-acetyltransferase